MMLLQKILLRCGAVLMLVGTELGGCNLSVGIDGMLSAPRLTAEQEQIYQTLQKAAGTGISLKYPKSGEYLSAFTVTDFDGDGADEAIVFYEVGASAEGNPLRICLLDQQGDGGAWRAVTDYPTAGAEVEWIRLAKLGTHDRINLIVGYSMVDGAEHAAEILHYEDGTLQQSLSVPYSSLDIRDLDADGTQELLVVTAASLTTAAEAAVYALDGEGIFHKTTPVALPDSFTEISHISYGKLMRDAFPQQNAGLAIYVDGMTGSSTLQTEILTYAEKQLSLIYADSPERYPNTVRSAGIYCMDIDGDGTVEIPVQTVFYGYTDADKNEQVSMIGWYGCHDGLLLRECASYYSAADGVAVVLPQRWEKKVTVVKENDEIVFYEWDTEQKFADGHPALKSPLLHLAVTATQEDAEMFLSRSDYLLMRQIGERYYFAKTESAGGSLALSSSELLFALRFVS